MPGQSGIHGFQSWVDFIKATISLGSMLTIGLLTVLTLALDGRYAPADVVNQVRANGQAASAVQAQVQDLQVVILQERIFEMRVRGCAASGEPRRFYAQRLQDLQRQYRDAAGKAAIIPACSDLQ